MTMIKTLSHQGLTFCAAGGLGLFLGICYDLGRAVRRERPGLTVPVDLLFALVFFLGLWLTAVYTWGLRLYQVLGMALGAGGYFWTASPLVLRVFRRALRGMGRVFGIFLVPAKKTLKFLKKLRKKLFPSARKWGTIHTIPFSRRQGREAKR